MQGDVKRSTSRGILGGALGGLVGQLTDLTNVSAHRKTAIRLAYGFQARLVAFARDILTRVSGAQAGNAVLQRDFYKYVSDLFNCFECDGIRSGITHVRVPRRHSCNLHATSLDCTISFCSTGTNVLTLSSKGSTAGIPSSSDVRSHH